MMLDLTYILPLRYERQEPVTELTNYLRRLAQHVTVIVVDGSPPALFAQHARAWGRYTLHVPPSPHLVTPNGKVGGVLTGVARAAHDKLIVADDDVRYDLSGLRRMSALLDEAEVVRPQNYFGPLPWHACWDTARSLLNRMLGGDWPGTLGVRRSALVATGGYAGDVLFENLELVRTVRAAGGREVVALDLFVRRLPPTAQHFWTQRVRQAYDEFARPVRLGTSLALLPLTVLLAAQRRWLALAAGITASVGLAEAGRQRAGGTAAFPLLASLLAPAWLVERAICSWLACWQRLAHGGVRYRNTVLRKAATSERVLTTRFQAATGQVVRREGEVAEGDVKDLKVLRHK